jgi:CHAT domain-containing protein
MNPRNPLFTRLQLSPGSGGPEDDGVLYVHEILGLESRSPLIFLSACETGVANAWSPAVVGGRDLTTLAQALLYGGAPAVVATLWRIEDSSAANLASSFYEGLARLSPVEALARAQRELLSNPDTRAPFFWAAYVLNGAGL